jgi:hypothetical protein
MNFGSYAEAQAYASSHQPGNYSVIGIDPLVSPVPLEGLDGYRLAWQSSQQVGIGGSTAVPEVKIFELTAATSE